MATGEGTAQGERAEKREEQAFFSPIPRAVWGLVAAGRLARRDAALLGALLDYRPRGGSVVWPTQQELARRLGCSLDTVQRGVARLCAAELVAKAPRRDAAGRLRGQSYDLAGTLARMPVQTAFLRLRSEGVLEGDSGAFPSETDPAPKPQKCGPEENKKCLKKADIPRLRAETERELAAAGVHVRVAQALWERYGDAACRRQLRALPLRTGVQDRPAALVAAIQNDWRLPKGVPTALVAPPVRLISPTAAPTVFPVAVGPRPRPACLGPAAIVAAPTPSLPADPLDSLAPAEYARLERDTRAELARLPELQALLQRDRCAEIVRSRMRTRLRMAG